MQNIIKARNHIVFILALIVGTVVIYHLDKLEFKHKNLNAIEISEIEYIAPDINFTKQILTKEDLKIAQIAWRYFENNYNKNSGLVNSVDKYPSTTLWDSGNYLMALISAFKLEIIDRDIFNTRVTKILQTLSNIKLYNDELPNKVYHTQTMQMVNYQNKFTPKGIGWSAIDIGRMLVPLNILNFYYPEFNNLIRKTLIRWNINKLSIKGETHGGAFDGKKELLVQEGRLGYEQFTAKMFASIGLDVTNSMRYDRYLEFINIYGIDIPVDVRDAKSKFKANNYVVSEPYFLDGMEFGWDSYSKEFAYRIYEVQKRRFKDTKVLTAVSEDHLDKSPYFIYNNIFVNGDEWVAITEDGIIQNDFKLLSTKTAFAFHSLFNDKYSQKLFDKVKKLYSEDRGFYAGIYEKDREVNKAITCNTNAIILESLAFKKFGVLFKLTRN